jgi:hypothetical protein
MLSSFAPNLVTNPKSRRRWLVGHVINVGQTRVTKKYFETNPVGRRRLQGTRLRWTEAAENDLRELSM